MECPVCRLFSVPNAQRCDCGYVFTGKSARDMDQTRGHIGRGKLIAGTATLVGAGLLLSFFSLGGAPPLVMATISGSFAATGLGLLFKGITQCAKM